MATREAELKKITYFEGGTAAEYVVWLYKLAQQSETFQ